MNWMTKMAQSAAAVLALSLPAFGQTAAQTQGLLVVYGVAAPASEGDTDHREQIHFSLPADTAGRVYVRLYDPEINGTDDFTYGGPGDSLTTFRVIGGEGAFTQSFRPVMVTERERAPKVALTADPGKVLAEKQFDASPDTNGRWVNLGAVRARQGEVQGDRVHFRIDVDGTQGNDGNGYSVAVSTARDRNRAPEGLEMFSYQPTIRWQRDNTSTRVTLLNAQAGPYKIQNFDGAKGDIALVTNYLDLPVRVSGQSYWSLDTVEAPEGILALSLEGGFETPNDVTVAVFDAAGSAVPLQMPPVSALDPARPTAEGTAEPLADCRAVAFDGSTSIGRSPLGYVWEFGDGNSATDAVIAHRYAEPGRYSATLKVLEQGTRPGRGDFVELPVHVRSGPSAKPGEAITVAPGDPVYFDGSESEPSDSAIARYLWSFGDGRVATGQSVQTTYEKPGLYRSSLRVEDDSNHPCFFGVETRLVTVNFKPVAEAGTDHTSEIGQTLRFDATASYDVDGKIERFEWDMGDGTMLDGAAVNHRYAKPGTFYATLTIYDDSGVSNNYAWDQAITVVNAPPEPKFTTPDRPLSVSEATMLSAEDTVDPDGVVLSYLWDFGDGAVGDGEEVSYAWTKPGVYNVSLTVTDNSGTGSATQQIIQQIVVDAAPVSQAGEDQRVTASEVAFDGTGSTDAEGGISSYEWDFGDGSIGTGPTPVHAYARPGTYEVALTVEDESGAPQNSDRDTLKVVINATPIADAGPPLTVAPGEEFVLSGRSSVDPDGAITEHLWTLPDGSTRNAERISANLSEPGLYRFGLTVTDDFESDVARDRAETLITVNATPIAEAGADLLVAPGDLVRLDAGLSYDPDGTLQSFRWEFSDDADPIETQVATRSFDTAGVFSAQVVVTDDSGVANGADSDDLTIRVNHAPVAEAGARQDIEVLQVQFDGSASSDADGGQLIYTWDFGDGTDPVQGAKATHVYAKSGVYPVTLRVDDGTGLSNATAVDTTIVTIRTRPIAMAGANRDVCSGQSILFDASDSVDPDGGLLLYSWDFGDGETSDLVNPTKIYERPGAYPITLTVKNGTGSDWGTDTSRIAALVREGPIADAGPDLTVCTNQAVRFDGSGSTDADGAVNAFSWAFGDGGRASGERPEYRFKKPGNYVVNLTITGEALGTCSPLDTDSLNITVEAAPDQKIIGSDRAAAGMPAAFSAGLESLDGVSVVSHNWSFSDGTTATGAEVTHVFAEPGSYFVTLATQLSGGNPGCSTIETRRKVTVNNAPMAAFEVKDQLAMGEAVIFDAANSADPDGVITQYAWDFGDGSLAKGLRPSHRFDAPGVYKVALTVTDDADVGNSAKTITRDVVVNATPVADLKAPQWVCAASDLPWKVATTEGTDVLWTFGDGATATGAEVRHQFTDPGLYPVTVTLDDGKGLANSTRSEESYVRVNATPSAFAGRDQVVCPGDVTVFDAGMSADIDGEIIEHIWTFSDGVVLKGARVKRSFDVAGDVTVELTVRDNSGLQCGIGTDKANVLVNHSPVVDAGPDLSTLLGAAHDVMQFDATNAQDLDGQGLSLSWQFGDGGAATGAVARHRYSKPGSYTVTVEARDTSGLTCGVAQDTMTVTALPRD